MATDPKSTVKQLESHLDFLDSYEFLDAELLPIFRDRRFSRPSDVVEAAITLSPEFAQDTRYWLLSAIQRNLITRDADGSFELSSTGSDELKQPA